MNNIKKLIEQWKKEEKIPFYGWDFSYLKGRLKEEKLPWDYEAISKKLIKKSKSVIDMGTGGGEIFSTLSPFPSHAVATEGYKPNYYIAKKRLEPLGVKVVDFEDSDVGKMPFENEEFDLVLNRHDAFNSKEVYRILKKNGVFLTQQVGGGNLQDLINEFKATTGLKEWTLSSIKKDLQKAGFKIIKANEWKGHMQFKDVCALVYYLKSVPWVVEGFSVSKHIKYLKKLQRKIDSGEKLIYTSVRYLVLAEKYSKP